MRWRDGRLEEWKIGGMEDWKGGEGRLLQSSTLLRALVQEEILRKS